MSWNRATWTFSENTASNSDSVNSGTLPGAVSSGRSRCRRVSSFSLFRCGTFALCLALSLNLSSSVHAEESSPGREDVWNQFLSRYVDDFGRVDYEAVQKDPSLLNAYLNLLAGLELGPFLAEATREERLATFLNAYHAGLVKLIVDAYPVKTVQAIPGGWDKRVVRFGEDVLSLNMIRQDHLLGTFRDEKIHMALACASPTCPGFPSVAFSPERVEGQLYLAARAFVNDSSFVLIDPEKKTVRLSRIFKWYAKDFRLDFGIQVDSGGFDPGEGAVISFLAHYLDDRDKIGFLESRDYKIKYLPFDWSLHEWHRDRPSAEA